MKPLLPILMITALVATSCVSLGKYENLEAKNRRIQKELATARQEIAQMKDENAELVRQNQTLSQGMGEADNARQESDENVRRLTRELESSIHRYDTMAENYQQQISGKERDLDKTNSLLESRTQEMNEQSEAFRRQQQELQESEAAAKAALAAKQQELDQIRQSIATALVGFADKGMQVETKEGKVYVSMESKLMFASGKWAVSDEGDQAIRQLAQVLQTNTDLSIMVEGHTDTDEYRGTSDVKDNWDLSVMRATAIVKLLLHYGPDIDPQRIVAAGHGPYMPRAANDTPEHKAQNRRTEIILTPKIAELLDIIGE